MIVLNIGILLLGITVGSLITTVYWITKMPSLTAKSRTLRSIANIQRDKVSVMVPRDNDDYMDEMTMGKDRKELIDGIKYELQQDD